MPKYIIEGGIPLRGKVRISGSKNAAMKMIAASILTDGEVVLSNVPQIEDVAVIKRMVEGIGIKTERVNDHKLRLSGGSVFSNTIPLDLSSKSRSAIVLVGPLLARFGEAAISEPKDCPLGPRPINRHLEALQALGAEISHQEGVYRLKAKKLVGTAIKFEKNTVMGTENAILAACLAEGKTRIVNAAQEPEVDDLIDLLRGMGAQVERVEDRLIEIEGVSSLSSASYEIPPDGNESVEFAVAVAITHGDITLEGVRIKDLTPFLTKLDKIGVHYDSTGGSLRVWAEEDLKFNPVDIETAAFPGFKTDWQAPFALLLTQAEGESMIHDTVYISRFDYAKELNRMKAKIVSMTPSGVGLEPVVSDDSWDFKRNGEPLTAARINGPTSLKGSKLNIPDLRDGAVLVLAALAAEGRSEISGIEHLDRGYEDLDGRLRALGAKIERVG